MLALIAYLVVEDGIHAHEKLAALLGPDEADQPGRAMLRSRLFYTMALPGVRPLSQSGVSPSPSSLPEAPLIMRSAEFAKPVAGFDAARRGQIGSDRSAVPGVPELIHARLARLTPGAVELLAPGSLLGQRVDFEVVAGAVGVPARLAEASGDVDADLQQLPTGINPGPSARWGQPGSKTGSVLVDLKALAA
jgi:hypothetical protein